MDPQTTILKDYPKGYFTTKGFTKKHTLVIGFRFPAVANCKEILAQIAELEEGIPTLSYAEPIILSKFNAVLVKRKEEAKTYGCALSDIGLGAGKDTNPKGTNPPSGTTTDKPGFPALLPNKNNSLYYVAGIGALVLGITAYFTFRKKSIK